MRKMLETNFGQLICCEGKSTCEAWERYSSVSLKYLKLFSPSDYSPADINDDTLWVYLPNMEPELTSEDILILKL